MTSIIIFLQSTYKSNLEGYTTQISADKNSEEYRKMEAQAARLAQEIEGSSTNKLAIELENGDEEEAFSAVVRNKGGTLHSGMNPSKIISFHLYLKIFYYIIRINNIQKSEIPVNLILENRYPKFRILKK